MRVFSHYVNCIYSAICVLHVHCAHTIGLNPYQINIIQNLSVDGINRLNANPCHAKLIYLNFHPLEVVSRYRDPQLQVGENYSYLFNLRSIKS